MKEWLANNVKWLFMVGPVKRFLGWLNTLVTKSLDTKDTTVSSTRLQSYMLLASVLGASFFFLGVEVVNAVIAWHTSTPYFPSNEFLVSYGMLLTHHLAVLFNRNKTIAPTDNRSGDQPPAKTRKTGKTSGGDQPPADPEQDNPTI